MKHVPYYLWWITDERGRRRKTTYRMREEEALARYPDAQPVPGSCEFRDVPESIDEHQHTQPGR